MPNPGERAIVAAEDHAAALALVTDWLKASPSTRHLSTGAALELVGMIAATHAEARADARAEGSRPVRPVLSAVCKLPACGCSGDAHP